MAPPTPEQVSPHAFTFAGGHVLEEPAPSLFGALLSGLSSMLIHLGVLISLGLWITAGSDNGGILEPLVVRYEPEAERELDLETVFLDEEITPGSHATFVSTKTPKPASDPVAPHPPQLLPTPLAAIDWPKDHLSGIKDLMAPVGEGSTASAQAVVDDYGQALDRITQELLRLAAKQKVLLVWCFDQSGSMKDDQQEIRARLERVYVELGTTGVTESDNLMTAVTSFGAKFVVHTERPTTDLAVIREAIDAVPVDPSGQEMMCSAVIRSIASYQQFARRQDRKMALILVTDESGHPQESDTYLEAAIDQAASARCPVYVLGREAVFGYPFAYIRWVHPQTDRVHELPMDRGPESAFAEVLQIDGLEPRSDAHPSGFGPYAQSRLAWRSGGIFFMLPSVEAELIGAEKLRYDALTMHDYRPDLRSREEILVDSQRRPLRKLLWKIVDDLNPQRPKAATMMRLRTNFAADPNQFRRQAQEALGRAQLFLGGLERAFKALEDQEPARQREKSLRWQANYDLTRAQVPAYAARVYLYGVALENGMKKLIVTPPALADGRQLSGWRIRESRQVAIDKAATKLLEQAKESYLAVIENHPGTPWAARAERELRRDFNYTGGSSGSEVGSIQAVELAPQYRVPPGLEKPGAKSRAKPEPTGPDGRPVPIPRL